MKALIDTNVILDVLCDRKEFVGRAAEIFRLCEIGAIEGYISALSVPNIIYIMRRELDKTKTKEVITRLFMIFGVVDLEGDDLLKAVSYDFGDYEDAVQSAAAARIGADCIVTRNIKDFSASTVPAVTPDALIAEMGYNQN